VTKNVTDLKTKSALGYTPVYFAEKQTVYKEKSTQLWSDVALIA